DFHAEDWIDLSGATGISDFTELLAKTTNVGGNAVINFGGGNRITLTGVSKASLQADDFTFGDEVFVSHLRGGDGVRITGASRLEFSGSSVAGAGDFNGDGFDDLIIGARWARFDNDGISGLSYVVFGTAEGFSADFNLSSINGKNGFRLGGGGNA